MHPSVWRSVPICLTQWLVFVLCFTRVLQVYNAPVCLAQWLLFALCFARERARACNVQSNLLNLLRLAVMNSDYVAFTLCVRGIRVMFL